MVNWWFQSQPNGKFDDGKHYCFTKIIDIIGKVNPTTIVIDDCSISSIFSLLWIAHGETCWHHPGNAPHCGELVASHRQGTLTSLKRLKDEPEDGDGLRAIEDELKILCSY